MRQAQTLFLWTLTAALPSLAVAQSSAPPKPAAVLDAATPVAAPHYESLPVSAKIVEQIGDWIAANTAVAQFPRGHADVLRWEKSQAAQKPSPEPPTVPSHEHLQHGGQP